MLDFVTKCLDSMDAQTEVRQPATPDKSCASMPELS